MKIFVALCMIIAAVTAQQDVPNPYSFNYVSETEDGGSSSHQETGDGQGRVTGTYSLNNLEGHSRTVEYIGDETGFHVTVRTNEPGTSNLNPADVVMDSSAPEANAGLSMTSAAAAAGVRPPVERPAVRAPRPVASVPVRRPMARPAAPATGGRAGARYVLVPETDPRAAGYM